MFMVILFFRLAKFSFIILLNVFSVLLNLEFPHFTIPIILRFGFYSVPGFFDGLCQELFIFNIFFD